MCVDWTRVAVVKKPYNMTCLFSELLNGELLEDVELCLKI